MDSGGTLVDRMEHIFRAMADDADAPDPVIERTDAETLRVFIPQQRPEGTDVEVLVADGAITLRWNEGEDEAACADDLPNVVASVQHLLDPHFTTRIERDRLEDASIALDEHPQDRDARRAYADALCDLGRVETDKWHDYHQDARQIYDALLDEDDADGPVLNNKAVIYIDAGKYEPAEVLLRDALPLLPEDRTVRNNLGTVLMSLDRIEEGRAMKLEAAGLPPDPRTRVARFRPPREDQ